jgi:hypothetical protein
VGWVLRIDPILADDRTRLGSPAWNFLGIGGAGRAVEPRVQRIHLGVGRPQDLIEVNPMAPNLSVTAAAGTLRQALRGVGHRLGLQKGVVGMHIAHSGF